VMSTQPGTSPRSELVVLGLSGKRAVCEFMALR